MDGIQKTVHEGLMLLAKNVANGVYGENDDAFQDEDLAEQFLNDIHDNILDKMT